MRQGGQVLPVVLASIVLAAAALFVMASVGNKFTERSKVVNAADASAYSAAVWTARHMNFLAYTNRAMIANHVGVGHFIAYLSWIRYVEDTTGKVAVLTQAIPFVNAATQAVDEFAEILVQLAEAEAKIFVPAADILNRFYFVAQAEAQASLVVNSVTEVMERTATRFDDALVVNDDAAIESLPNSVVLPIRLALGIQRVAIPLFVRPMSVVDRDGEFVKVTEATFGRLDSGELDGARRRLSNDLQGGMSDEWLNDRGFDIDLFFIEVEKDFATDHDLSNELSEWSAEDELEVELRPSGPFGPSIELELAGGEASTSEFDDNYRGVFSYYNQTLFDARNYTLPLLAMASLPQVEAGVADGILGISSGGFISGLSIAQVEFKRPAIGFDSYRDNNQTFANLYNPFWQARLVSTGL